MRAVTAPVVVDPERGHITVGDMVFCDMGQHLSVWAYSGADLTPALAYDLGMALLAWQADTRFAEGMRAVCDALDAEQTA